MKVADQNLIDFAWRLTRILPADHLKPGELIRWAQENGYDEWLRGYGGYKRENLNRAEHDSTSIPGDMPKTRNRILAVQAAWEIECETGRAALRDDVMERLQLWADDGKHPDVLLGSDKKNRAVIWITARGTQKSFDRDACAKALRQWNNSRKS